MSNVHYWDADFLYGTHRMLLDRITQNDVDRMLFAIISYLIGMLYAVVVLFERSGSIEHVHVEMIIHVLDEQFDSSGYMCTRMKRSVHYIVVNSQYPHYQNSRMPI